MLRYEVSLPVRYYETDQMGVVHHSNYLRYFECARSAMMKEWGYPMEVCEAEGITIPVVELDCKYKLPATMGDVLSVTAVVESVPQVKMLVKQEVRNQRGELCACGSVTIAFLNKQTGKPIRCPERIVNIIKDNLNF